MTTKRLALALHLASILAAFAALPLPGALLVAAGLAVSMIHQLRRAPPTDVSRGRILGARLVIAAPEPGKTEGGVLLSRDPDALRGIRRALRWPQAGGSA